MSLDARKSPVTWLFFQQHVQAEKAYNKRYVLLDLLEYWIEFVTIELLYVKFVFI